MNHFLSNGEKYVEVDGGDLEDVILMILAMRIQWNISY